MTTDLIMGANMITTATIVPVLPANSNRHYSDHFTALLAVYKAPTVVITALAHVWG